MHPVLDLLGDDSSAQATTDAAGSRRAISFERFGPLTTDDIYASTRQVAEGAKSCASLHALAQREGVYVPIAEAVDAVVAGKMTAADTMEVHLPRHQGRDGLEVSPSRAALEVGPEVVDVLDTDGHPDEALGDGGGLGLPARRRSKVDSTPPSEVACTHNDVACVSRSAASAVGSTTEIDRAEARVADTRWPGATSSRRASSAALACARSTRR